MPTYEYTCPDGHDFEQFVLKMSLGAAHLPCPTCGKPSARKISAGGGLLFKGSGFYITDYGKDGKKDLREGAKAAAATAGGGTSAESSSGTGAKEGPAESAKSPAKESPADASRGGSKDAAKTAPAAAPAPAAKKKSDSE